MDLERHPPERGTLPVVVAGGCCTTCCCCCCCCAYVVTGLVGAAVGSALVRRDARTVEPIRRYWSLVGYVLLSMLAFCVIGLVAHGFLILAAAVALVVLPLAQGFGSLLLLINRDPAVRNAALKITGAWLACTVLGLWLTALMFKS